MKSAVKVIGINLLIFIALLLIIEISVRVVHPDINPQNLDITLLVPKKFGETYGYRAHARGSEFGATVITDAYGFRNDPTNSVANRDKTILVLGDSVSVGLGVEAETAYPWLIQKRLKSYKVMNASATGYNLADYNNVLRSLLGKSSADGVIIGVCLNDITETSQANIIEALRPEPQHAALGSPAIIETSKDRYPNPIVRVLRHINDNYIHFNDLLKQYSRAYLWIKSLATDSSHDYFTADALIYQNEKVAAVVASQLGKLRDTAKEHNVWLVLFILPYEYQLRAQTEAVLFPQRLILEEARQAGIHAYDVYSGLHERIRNSGILRSRYIYSMTPCTFPHRGTILLPMSYMKNWSTIGSLLCRTN